MKVLYVIVLFVLSMSITHARIGEKKMSMENRLLSKISGAYLYDTKEAMFREIQELPYLYQVLLFPKEVEHRFYFKVADDKQTKGSDITQQQELYGWEVHIAFKSGTSVMEMYKRCGEPLSVEELEALMQLMIAGKKDVYWIKDDFVEKKRTWNVAAKNGNLKLVDNNGETFNKKLPLKDILPISDDRYIFIEIPKSVQNWGDYSSSLQFKIMEEEQRTSYDEYNKKVEEKATYRAAKTAKGTSSSSTTVTKINKFATYTHRTLESLMLEETENFTKANILKYTLEDILYGNKYFIDRRLKDIKLAMYIPQQPDTFIGYSYKTSDNSMRAKLYGSGVLFIDTKFDKSIRDTIEALYKEQGAARVNAAKSSLSKF